MRDGLPRAGRWVLSALGAALVLGAWPAFGQVPQPKVPEIERRSGLLSRFVPIEPHLPPDPRRDNWYDTRVGDRPFPPHRNSVKEGGMYGYFWPATCTASVYPYFYGAPGQSTLGPECRPGHRSLRVFQGLLHPFKPVGMYYDQGSYVPLYDLDPIVPGPGPYPIPWFFRGPAGG